MTEINGIRLPFMPVGGINDLQKKPQVAEQQESKETFRKIFEEELDNLKFSAHAKARINSREIDFGQADALRLNKAVERAEAKGAKESLILMDDKAFIVSVVNRTVITAVNRSSLNSNVITNIDSAVIA